MTKTEAVAGTSTGALLKMYAAVEYDWLMKGRQPGHEPFLGWMPYQMSDFVAIMVDCAMESEGNRFLDVGSGPGTKMALASTLFGFSATGVERDFRSMFTAAKLNGEADLFIEDALYVEDGFYSNYDVIWLYRPFRNADLEQRLEDRIRSEMKSGAILAGGAWESPCPANWLSVVDDWELRRGAWKKP